MVLRGLFQVAWMILLMHLLPHAGILIDVFIAYLKKKLPTIFSFLTTFFLFFLLEITKLDCTFGIYKGDCFYLFCFLLMNIVENFTNGH